MLATLRAHPQLTGLSVNRRNLDAQLAQPAPPDTTALIAAHLRSAPRSYDDVRPAIADVGL